MPFSVQLMSILPWGQPEPPDTTLLILNESGAWFVGAAAATATRARVVNVHFIVVVSWPLMFDLDRKRLDGLV
jgi:hypothetical protein